jgi:predicted RNA binding protein YcfA (HicA-like mRNA interferase family)
MSQFDKLYAQIVNNPKDVTLNDLDKLLRRYGFNCRQPGKGSSHFTYYHPELPDILTIPKERPIKAVYVKQAITLMQKLKEKGDIE